MRHELPDNDRISVSMDDAGIAHVRLNRPEKYNALDQKMFDAVIDAANVLFDLPGLRCVVVSGEGRAFCAGLDLSMFEVLAKPETDFIRRTHGNANMFQQVAVQWRKLSVPVIAAVHGICFGGGLQIAAGADIRVVAPDANLAVMEARWGVIPDMSHFALWRGLVREDVLRELTYTAREFSGAYAAEIGFATHCDADPLPRAMAIAAEIVRRNPAATRADKALFNRSLDMPFDDILMEESIIQQRLIGSANQLEAIRAHMEKRDPVFSDG